jgi:hypothetical protein
MPSRRRSRSKNLGTNLADVQRRMRYLERRPNRTKLQTKVVKAIHITPETITPKEVNFGTTVVTTVEPTENLKEGIVWVNPDDGATNVYSAEINEFVTVTDANAVEALTIAQGKNKTYVQPAEPTGDTYYEGDLWIDTDDGNKLYVYSGTGWVSRQDTAISAAQASANGKNTVYYSTSTPGSTENIVGDIWWKYGFTRAVSNKALTGNVATLTTDSAHGLSVGTEVKISGINSTFNGTYTVDSIPTTTTFTYAKTAANVASSAVSPTGTLLYSDGIITGQWVGGGGTTWRSNTIGNLVIANIDAGKITTGYLDVSGAVRITTSATASGTGGNTSRIELNSNGFYAYNGSVATVSITNTGTAVFSGTVNATGGTFTGYVTAGTARFGAAVQTGKNGIYINANNYWYDDGTFKTGTGTSSITYDETGALTIGSGTAIAGITASVLAAGASEGATALQPGNGILDNGSDQIVSISTASGIVIGTDPSKSLNEARVELRASGFYAYDGTGPTVSILANGNAEFKGTVKAGSLIVGTDAATLVSYAAQGETALQPGNGVGDNGSDQITSISTAYGIIIGTRVDSTGARVEINSGGFFAYDSSGETVGITSAGVARFKGSVTGSSFTSTYYASGDGVAITSPSAGIDQILFNKSGSQVSSYSVVSGGVVIQTGSSQLTMTTAGSTLLTSSGNQLSLGSVLYLLNGSGGNSGIGNIRNTFASSGDPSGGSEGDVWLKYA